MEQRLAIPYIQAARGIAVVLVMLFHTSQLATKYYPINFLGVNSMDRSGGYAYFFVLTGFLMVTIYRRHFGNIQMWKTFIIKRLVRIYPIYWLVNAAVIPIYFLAPSFGNGYETKSLEIVTSLLLLPYSQVPILGVAWSLVYIMFFYLIFSLLFVLSKKTMLTLFTLWLLIVGLHSMGWIKLVDSVLIRFLFDAMHLEFVLGMLIAYAVTRLKAGSGLWLAAGMLVFPAVWVARFMDPGFGYSNMLYTVGSSLVLLGIGSLRIAAPTWLKPLQFLGDASYSILLTSLAFLSISLKLTKALHLSNWFGPTLTTSLCFATALTMCCVFYYYIEKPLIKRLKSITAAKGTGSLVQQRTEAR
ncbi:acyltransferase family protein [Paenibacillus sp. LMG 31456]|uniref:Acyltransferase family protein n=1 Tax=Paenibacillus foliorum TaxID=2654974 RepID=A0A972H4Y1_9BACL|nr:acyltransferase [Paenibacillus foliorum]NOU96406.1 acyltransferase family protein [Paenibacillus foliorum]